MTDNDYNIIKDKANKLGMSIGEYMTTSARDNKPKLSKAYKKSIVADTVRLLQATNNLKSAVIEGPGCMYQQERICKLADEIEREVEKIYGSVVNCK